MNEARLLAETRLTGKGPQYTVFNRDERRLLSGQDRDRLAWIFSPLGFKPGRKHHTIVPTYPSGLPLHIVVSSWVFGWELGPKLISPLACLLSVVLMYFLARELTISRAAAAAGALILAAWPPHIRNGLHPMSDCLATFWALAAVLGALLARRHVAWAIACGAAFGLGVLVRPNNILLVLPVLLLLPWKVKHLLLYALGGLPFGVFFLVFNRSVYGNAFVSGYGDVTAEMSLDLFPARVVHYSYWLAVTLTPLLPLAWLLLPLDRRVAPRERWAMMLWFAPFMLFYCFWKSYDQWWYMRFLAPAAPALIIASLLLARDAGLWLKQRRPTSRCRTALAVGLPMGLLCLILSVQTLQTIRHKVLQISVEAQRYRGGCAWASGQMTDKSLVMCMQISGALKYYTSAIPVRWDLATREDFESMRPLAERHGYRWYALLSPREECDERWRTRHWPAGWERIGTFSGGRWTLWRLRPTSGVPPSGEAAATVGDTSPQ